MDSIYKNIEEYNPNKKRKILIIFDDMIANMLNNKKLNPIETELFITGRKLNESLVFITKPYFAVLKELDQILCTILLWKFQINKNFKKLHLPIHQILILKASWIFMKNVPQNHIFSYYYWCYSCILLYYTFQKESFRENTKTNHDNWW